MKNIINNIKKISMFLIIVAGFLSLSGCIRFYGGDRELDFCTNDPKKVTTGVRYCPSEPQNAAKDKQ